MQLMVVHLCFSPEIMHIQPSKMVPLYCFSPKSCTSSHLTFQGNMLILNQSARSNVFELQFSHELQSPSAIFGDVCDGYELISARGISRYICKKKKKEIIHQSGPKNYFVSQTKKYSFWHSTIYCHNWPAKQPVRRNGARCIFRPMQSIFPTPSKPAVLSNT